MPNTKFPYPKRDTLRITLVYLEDILGMSGGLYIPNPIFPYPKRNILRITLVYFEDILGMSGGYVWTMDILGLS